MFRPSLTTRASMRRALCTMLSAVGSSEVQSSGTTPTGRPSSSGWVLTAAGRPCYVWVFLPNHIHLLPRAGAVPLTTVMRRLLTG